MDFYQSIRSAGDILYEFAISLIMIPRTLAKVIRNPGWVPEYITSQEKEKAQSRFDKYSHPTLFWLIIGVLSYYFLLEFLIQGYAEVEVIDLYNSISFGTKFTGFIIFFISVPVSFAMVLHLFKYKRLDKTSFKRSFLIQCYITAPVQLFFIPSLFIDEVSDGWSLLFSIISLSIIVWFLIAEFSIIRKELFYNWIKAIGLFALMYVSYFVFVSITMILFILLNMNNFRRLVDVYLENA